MAIGSEVVRWLMDGDPSVRLRVARDLLDRPPDHPDRTEPARQVGQEGWAASILEQQLADGQWSTPGTSAVDLYRPKYVATNWQFIVLGELGATRSDPRIVKAVRLYLDRFSTPPHDGFGGSDSEVCFTGNAVRTMHHLGFADDPRVDRATTWLIQAQKPDGGWHCFAEKYGTLDAWEALAAFAAIPRERRSAPMERAIESGATFFLERGLMDEGGGGYPPWKRLHYPVHYYYDVLVGLDVLTSLGFGDDRRLGPALDWLESRRRDDGRWPLDALQPDISEGDPYSTPSFRSPYFSFGLELPGQPSRWITTTALRVLRRAGRL